MLCRLWKMCEEVWQSSSDCDF